LISLSTAGKKDKISEGVTNPRCFPFSANWVAPEEEVFSSFSFSLSFSPSFFEGLPFDGIGGGGLTAAFFLSS
jgi:hypothetical protein